MTIEVYVPAIRGHISNSLETLARAIAGLEALEQLPLASAAAPSSSSPGIDEEASSPSSRRSAR